MTWGAIAVFAVLLAWTVWPRRDDTPRGRDLCPPYDGEGGGGKEPWEE